jgi:hypothetical protein
VKRLILTGRVNLVLRVKQNQPTSRNPTSTFAVEVVFGVENAVLLSEFVNELWRFPNREGSGGVCAKSV